MRKKSLFQKLFYSLVILGISCAQPILAASSNDSYARQWNYNMVHVYDAWDEATGSRDVVVAIIDNGFDMLHRDLRDNVWKNEGEIPDNGIDDDHNGYIDDVWGWNFVPTDFNDDGTVDEQENFGNNNPRPDPSNITDLEREQGTVHHATVVASIIGAVGNNGLDMAGMNWKVRLMNIRAVDSHGEGEMEPLVRAIYYATDNGADVINISLVGFESIPELKVAIDYAYSRGVVIVAAAGNDRVNLNESPRYPVCSDEGESEVKVIGVSAIEPSRYFASFSNAGDDCIDIAAPGVDINGLLFYAPELQLEKHYGGSFSGTSFAAPHVSGAAALIKSIQPSWGAREINRALLESVSKTPPKDEDAYRQLYGAGLLQVRAAVNYALKASAHLYEQDLGYVAFGLEGGLFTARYKNPVQKDSFSELQSFWKGMSNVVPYKTLDGVNFIGTSEGTDGYHRIFEYNQKGERIRRFSVRARRVVDTLVISDPQDLILLVELEDGSFEVRKYKLNGILEGSFTLNSQVKGISLYEQKGLIAILEEKKNGDFSIQTFSDEFTLKNTILLSSLSSVSDFVVTDDFQKKFFVSGTIGNLPYIASYDATGNKSGGFFPFSHLGEGELRLEIDLSQSGNDIKLLTYFDSAQFPGRVYTLDGKKTDEFSFFDNQDHFIRIYAL